MFVATPYTSGSRACNHDGEIVYSKCEQMVPVEQKVGVKSWYQNVGMQTNFCTNRPNGYYCTYGNVDVNSLLIGCMLIKPKR